MDEQISELLGTKLGSMLDRVSKHDLSAILYFKENTIPPIFIWFYDYTACFMPGIASLSIADFIKTHLSHFYTEDELLMITLKYS